MTDLERLYTVTEVADALRNASERYVLDKCRRKEWPHHRVGRSFVFTEQDFQAILELSATAAAAEPTGLSFAPRARRGAA